VTVRIPAALREFADGRSEVEVDAKTVADALAKIGGDYPLIMERIVDQRGAIRPLSMSSSAQPASATVTVWRPPSARAISLQSFQRWPGAER
jgi:hypothetical protein